MHETNTGKLKDIQIFNMKLEEIIEEQYDSILKTSKNRPLVDAIVNRHPITFYYSGPRKPKKKSVKAGYRVKAEAVGARGSSKAASSPTITVIDLPRFMEKP